MAAGVGSAHTTQVALSPGQVGWGDTAERESTNLPQLELKGPPQLELPEHKVISLKRVVEMVTKMRT